MDITKILSIQALEFDIWGFHIKANLMMSIFIILLIAVCWVWHRYQVLKQIKIKDNLANEKSIRDAEIEKQKLILELLHNLLLPNLTQFKIINASN